MIIVQYFCTSAGISVAQLGDMAIISPVLHFLTTNHLALLLQTYLAHNLLKPDKQLQRLTF